MWIGKVGEYETVHPGDDGAPGGEHPHPEGDVHRKKACHRGLRELLKKPSNFSSFLEGSLGLPGWISY